MPLQYYIDIYIHCEVVNGKLLIYVYFLFTIFIRKKVSEVLSKDKCRLSISGWFYGESVPRPVCKPEPKRKAEAPREDKV